MSDALRLAARLALADLVRERANLICNAAMIAGVLVPLLVVFGVQSGVYGALMTDLRSDPATLRIDTVANTAFAPEDAERVRAWSGVDFVVLRSRAVADYVNVQAAGGGPIREAIATPTGPGDPLLPEGLGIGPDEAAVSALLARQLGLAEGQGITVVTSALDRPRQLRLDLTVVHVLGEDRLSGRAVMMPAGRLDLIEAFYDAYALPAYGIEAGRPLADRRTSFEGMRVHAAGLADVAPVQARLEAAFAVRTTARTELIAFWQGVGRKLAIAMAVLAAIGLAGLVVALAFSFWGEVARKRRVLATLMLLGLGPRAVAAFPAVQAAVTGAAGVVLSLLAFGAIAVTVNALFAGALPGQGAIIAIPPLTILGLALAAIVLVVLAAGQASRAAQRVDPGSVLRETG